MAKKKTDEEIEAELDAADAAEYGDDEKRPSMPDLDDILGSGGDEIDLDADEEGVVPVKREKELEAENADLRDKLLRAMAEMENLRKRAERDRRDAEVYGGQRLARDLLAVHDNMERAMSTIDDDLRVQAAALIEGLELTQKGLIDAFAKHHIEPVAPSEGDKFDPQIHQAVFEAPVQVQRRDISFK